MRKTVVIAAASLFVLSSCRFMSGEHIRGDGNVIVQNRSVKDFEAVDVSSSIDVYLTQDSAYSVKVEVDNNLQPFVETFLDGRKLVIKQANNTNLDASQHIKVYVSGPVYRALQASGACSILGQGRIVSESPLSIDLSGACHVKLDLKATSIDLGMSGACSAELSGEAKSLTLDGSGSTDLKAFDLVAENVKIGMSGAGDALVHATGSLDVDASGAASVRYKGNPSVKTDISGAGSVNKAD